MAKVKETEEKEPLSTTEAESIAALNEIVGRLNPLDQDARRRIINTLAVFFGVNICV